jgi:hypothetical protein
MASFLKSLVNRIGKAFKPKIDQSEMVSALRVPEPGEARRREKNLRGPEFGIEYRFVFAFLLALLLFAIAAHPKTWFFIFESLGYKNITLTEPKMDL